MALLLEVMPIRVAADQGGGGSPGSAASAFQRFSKAELRAMTDNFDIQINAGGFGTVYKGKLPDGRAVAVKRFNSNFDLRFFQREVNALARFNHPSIVPIVGYCYAEYAAADVERAIVFPLLTPLGTELLHRFSDADRALLFQHVGDALAHLHMNDCIHRDIKPDNILVRLAPSGALERAYLADLGFMSTLAPGASAVSTNPVETPHFLDPACTGRTVRRENDVYAFGITVQCVYAKVMRPGEQGAADLVGSFSEDVAAAVAPMLHHDFPQRPVAAELGRIVGQINAVDVLAVRSITRFMAPSDHTILFDSHRKVHYVVDGGLLRPLCAKALRFFDTANPKNVGNYDRTPLDHGTPWPQNVTVVQVVSRGHRRFYIRDCPYNAFDVESSARCWRQIAYPDRACILKASVEELDRLPPGDAVGPAFDSPDHWKHLDRHTVSLYENQRWTLFGGWSAKLLLPSDRPAQSLRDGSAPVTAIHNEASPPEGWKWATDWQIVVDDNSDAEGWTYAFDFPQRYSAHCAKTDCVRRRLHERVLQRPAKSSW
jgi:serine/threonine protein kinase